MPRRSWKHPQPTSLQEAIRACVEHAKRAHNRSVETVAELMGMESHWAIYKWMESGSIPGHRIRSFEFACGCEHITRYLAIKAHKLVIDIPTGRKATPEQIHRLQLHVSDAVGHLLSFYQDQSEESAQAAIWSVTEAMEEMAAHQGNVEKSLQPEFDFHE